MFSNYILYKVQTLPFKFDVERRFSDFYWLRNILIREYPGYFIPPMAKKTGKRSFEQFFINKRMGELQQFIESICENKELRSSLHFISFLKCKSRTQFEKIKKELLKQTSKISDLSSKFSKRLFEGKSGIDLKDFENINGETESVVSLEMKDYSVHLDEYIRAMVPQYDKLEIYSKQLVGDLEQVKLSMDKLRTAFNDVNKIQKKFNSDVPFGSNQPASNIYENLGSVMTVWKELATKQIKMVEDHFVHSFKYTAKELIVHYDVIFNLFKFLKFRNSAGSEYFRSYIDLEAKKDRLFSQGYQTSWGFNLKAHKLKREDLMKNKVLAKSLMLPEVKFI